MLLIPYFYITPICNDSLKVASLGEFLNAGQKIIQLRTGRKCDLVNDFESKGATLRKAHLADIFRQVNELNISIQGFCTNIIIGVKNHLYLSEN
ncbi:hypothetical protein CWI39_1740p0010 [Hamiltosporidium magnivora]|uniref:Uncharacterized protein n=1 Tax=Hamiltosporidium magnivora TaxID=148818 RepID=A0A4Q9KZ09_9MICR|nr:hypothetical protein CWI39_1740p0010 [Hamiltosporidium magnivora]